MAFRNDHVSYSRLDTYRQCPKRFEFSYVKGIRGSGSDATRFGSACHEALETCFREVSQDGGEVQESRLLEEFDRAFFAQGLLDEELHHEGVFILKRFLKAHGPVQPLQVKGCEVPFEEEIGGFVFKGFIDRVDDLGDGTIEVIDYKTNRQPYTSEQVDRSMQLALYRRVARRRWPWATRIVLTYWMLRLGYRQTTEMDDAVMDEVVGYMTGLAKGTESGVYPARVNPLCGWCDHRDICDDFSRACAEHPSADLSRPSGLEAMLSERERLAAVANSAKNRKDAIDTELRNVIRTRGDFTAGRSTVRGIQVTSTTMDPATVLREMEAVGMEVHEAASLVLDVDRRSLEAFLRDYASIHGRVKAMELESAMEENARRRVSVRLDVSRR